MLKKNILQIFRVIQVNQEIIDDFGAFSFNMNIRFIPTLCKADIALPQDIKMARSLLAAMTSMESSREGPLAIINTGTR